MTMSQLNTDSRSDQRRRLSGLWGRSAGDAMAWLWVDTLMLLRPHFRHGRRSAGAGPAMTEDARPARSCLVDLLELRLRVGDHLLGGFAGACLGEHIDHDVFRHALRQP